MIEKIHPDSGMSFCRKLNAYEQCFMRFNFSEVFIFTGNIEIDRFSSALRKALLLFDFMFCRLKNKNGNYYAEYSTNKPDDFFEFEHIDLPKKISEIKNDIKECLPNYPDFIVKMTDDDTNGLPIMAAKVTKLSNGWTLGYFFNHVFCDMSSMLTFWESVAMFYKNTGVAVCRPELVDSSKLLKNEYSIPFPSLQSFRDAGCSINSIYYPPDQVDNFNVPNYAVCSCRFEFNNDAIYNLAKESHLSVSRHDIITAIFIKLQTMDPNLQSHTLGVEFARNMRPLLGLNGRHIGNLTTTVQLPESTDASIKGSSILEIAQLVRRTITRNDTEKFMKVLNWYQQLEKMQENALYYIFRTAVDPAMLSLTSWAVHDRNRLSFGSDVDLLEVDAPFPPEPIYIGVVTEKFNESIPQLRVIINLPRAVLGYAKQFGMESGLFKIIRHVNKTTAPFSPSRGDIA